MMLADACVLGEKTMRRTAAKSQDKRGLRDDKLRRWRANDRTNHTEWAKQPSAMVRSLSMRVLLTHRCSIALSALRGQRYTTITSAIICWLCVQPLLYLDRYPRLLRDILLVQICWWGQRNTDFVPDHSACEKRETGEEYRPPNT